MTPLVRLPTGFKSSDEIYVLQVMGKDMKSTLYEVYVADADEAVTRAYKITREERCPVQIHRIRTVPVKEAMFVLWPENFWNKKEVSGDQS